MICWVAAMEIFPLVDNTSEHKKAKDLNRNVVEKLIHNKYKDVSLNNKCVRQSIDIIQSKIIK